MASTLKSDVTLANGTTLTGPEVFPTWSAMCRACKNSRLSHDVGQDISEQPHVMTCKAHGGAYCCDKNRGGQCPYFEWHK